MAVGWAAKMFVQQLVRIMEHRGKSCFFDAASLVGEEVATCLSHAGCAAVLVCVLDDAFPSKWCLGEINNAISKEVPIITIFDQDCFRFQDVGKEAWWRKGIPAEVVQAVFARGTIHFNSHPYFVQTAEQKFEECLMTLLQSQSPLPASVVQTPQAAKVDRNDNGQDQCTRQDVGDDVLKAVAMSRAVFARETTLLSHPTPRSHPFCPSKAKQTTDPSPRSHPLHPHRAEQKVDEQMMNWLQQHFLLLDQQSSLSGRVSWTHRANFGDEDNGSWTVSLGMSFAAFIFGIFVCGIWHERASH